MIRSFDWRDLSLVRRLSPQGICFDSETEFVRGMHTMQAALLTFMGAGAGHPTLVCRYKNGGRGEQAFGQLRHRHGSEIARLLYLAPAEAISCPAGVELLEALCREAGRRGAHNVLAEIRERDSGFETLRTLGFAIYARQDLYRLSGPAIHRPRSGNRLRPKKSVDEFGVRMLHANIVPRLVQQVEPPPASGRQGFVHSQAGEVLGYFDVSRGPLGIWVEPYLHPAAEDVDDLVAGLVSMLADRNGRPICFCVRSYLDWIRVALQEVGFELWAEQAVMVKRVAVPVVEFSAKRAPVLEGGAKVTTPFVNSNANGHDKRGLA